jgi:hypothetical protein
MNLITRPLFEGVTTKVYFKPFVDGALVTRTETASPPGTGPVALVNGLVTGKGVTVTAQVLLPEPHVAVIVATVFWVTLAAVNVCVATPVPGPVVAVGPTLPA